MQGTPRTENQKPDASVILMGTSIVLDAMAAYFGKLIIGIGSLVVLGAAIWQLYKNYPWTRNAKAAISVVLVVVELAFLFWVSHLQSLSEAPAGAPNSSINIQGNQTGNNINNIGNNNINNTGQIIFNLNEKPAIASKHIAFTQEAIGQLKPGYPYALKIVVRTDYVMDPVNLFILFSQDDSIDNSAVVGWGATNSPTEQIMPQSNVGVATDGKQKWPGVQIHCTCHPTLGPAYPFVINVQSKKPLSVEHVYEHVAESPTP